MEKHWAILASFVSVNIPKLYLLSGNGSIKAWWADCLPYFQHLEPLPLELPGYGSNASEQFQNLGQLADALLAMTEPGHKIFAVGINALVVLHALVKRPGHFSKVYLLAPVGAFLEERAFVRMMRGPLMAKFSHFLLARFPKLFARKFSSRTWTAAQYARMGEGYAQCRAFEAYFDFVQGWNALELFEWITDPVTLIWGTGDRVLDAGQVAAWDGILPRTQMEVIVKTDWEHYPYIDDPAEFAVFMESDPRGFLAHTKAGRLRLGTLAGLPVPAQVGVSNAGDIAAALPQLSPHKTYAVRSSGAQEDHIDHSNAGIHTTYLRVPIGEVAQRAQALLDMGLETAVIQEFVEPRVSGVAFVRWIAAEVELVEGHLEELVSGTVSPKRFVLSKMGGDWELLPTDLPAGFPLAQLHAFLKQCIRAFHYAHSDIEWAWDGQQFHMLQIRPVTGSDWRRSLSSANLDEILPRQVSRLMEHAQRQASLSISRLYALWDPRTLQDSEPFTVSHLDASYINSDLFLSRFKDWGLPSQLLANEIGGAVPKFGFNLLNFVHSIPLFLKMQRRTRKQILQTAQILQAFEQELQEIIAQKHKNPKPQNSTLPSDSKTQQDVKQEPQELEPQEVITQKHPNPKPQNSTPPSDSETQQDVEQEPQQITTQKHPNPKPENSTLPSDPENSENSALVGWFVRYYTFIVRQNMVINACLSSAMGSFWGRRKTVYGQMQEGQYPHRLKFESDPASMRLSDEVMPLEPFPRWSAGIHLLHRLGAPGLGGKYFEVREWFRDNNMRLFHQLHIALRGSEWLLPHTGIREKSGAFWQDGGAVMTQSHGFVIYPGRAEGIVGEEIMIVDALEPGHYEDYKKAKAVIARTGGRLSHGATLLRELKKPSAVMPLVGTDLLGQRVVYIDGELQVG
jgi:pimeloyl-ACP methyl ester carboxylesterase